MKPIFRPSEISVISAPVTSANMRNARNHPAVNLGRCTPFQMFSDIGMELDGAVCVMGNPSRGIGIANAMIRRNRKPFLFIGTAVDNVPLASALKPDWIQETAQSSIPSGNGALLFSKPYSSYLEMCEYMEIWAQDHFLIIHTGNGLQLGVEALGLLSTLGQCLIICDSIPQSVRDGEARSITPVEFMKKMKYLFVSSSGVSSKDLVDLLPTYQYEKVSNTTSINTYRGRSFFHPFHGHGGHGMSVGQTRAMDYKKSIFEVDDLKRIFDAGYMLAYNAATDGVFLAELI